MKLPELPPGYRWKLTYQGGAIPGVKAAIKGRVWTYASSWSSLRVWETMESTAEHAVEMALWDFNRRPDIRRRELSDLLEDE